MKEVRGRDTNVNDSFVIPKRLSVSFESMSLPVPYYSIFNQVGRTQ